MNSRSISVVLKANVTDFTRELGRATKGLDELVKKSGDASGASNTTMGKLAQSARLQADAWNTAGTNLLAVGAAITGVNVLVAKTGIEYNTLQQKSRAALTTILGGAQAANEQMDKLDEFARTSPFSKAVFIDAQQQMLGFGIEAQKVIPYLSAINETIAATGGNNNDLAEIVRIFSQISAAGKITATDLMQFGQRGVDAATLIGSQMGMTGAEIRSSITKGTLDAGDALDSLAAGMQGRFEGASAGVKNTMEGAFDRVKAAWRDLSASMVEPAVGQSGGGFLVDLTNGAADFLRGIDKLPAGVKNAAGALGGVTGAAALAAGAFALAVPKIYESVTAFKALTATFPRLIGAAGPVGLAIAGATTVIGIALAEMGRYAGEVDSYVDALKQGGTDAEKSARELHVQALAAEGVGEALKNLGIEAALATEAALGDADARQQIADAYDREIQALGDLIAAKLTAGEYTGDEAAALQALGDEHMRVTGIIDERARITAEAHESEKRQREEMQALMATDPETQRAWGEAVKAYHLEARGAIDQTKAATAELTDAEKEWLDTTAGASAGFIDHLGALEAAQQQYAERAAVNAGEAKDAWKDFAEGGKFALGDFEQALRDQFAAMDEWETNVIALASELGPAALDGLMELAKTAPDQAALLAKQMVDSGKEQWGEIPEYLGRMGGEGAGDMMALFDAKVSGWSYDDVMGALGEKGGMAMVREAAAKLQSGEATLGQIVASYDLRAVLDIDTYNAERAARAALDRISRMTVTVDVRARMLNANGFNAPVATGGYMQDVADAYYNRLAVGGQAMRIRPSGYLSGPGTGTSDSIPARLSTKEFVMNASATQHYGPDFMYRLNSRSVDRDWLRALGFAGGGSPSLSPSSSAPVASMVTRSSSVVSVGQINITTAAGTADSILADVAAQLPAFIAQKG